MALHVRDDGKSTEQPKKKVDKRDIRRGPKTTLLFTDEEVLTIRWIWEFGRFGLTKRKLAALYGVKEDYMEKLLSYTVRSHVRLQPTPDFVPRLLPAALQAK